MDGFQFWLDIFVLIIVFYEGVSFFKSKTKIGKDEDVALSVILSVLFTWVLYTYAKYLLYFIFILIIGQGIINKIYEEVKSG